MIVPLGVVRRGPMKNLLCGQNCQGAVVAAVIQRTGTGITESGCQAFWGLALHIMPIAVR